MALRRRPDRAKTASLSPPAHADVCARRAWCAGPLSPSGRSRAAVRAPGPAVRRPRHDRPWHPYAAARPATIPSPSRGTLRDSAAGPPALPGPQRVPDLCQSGRDRVAQGPAAWVPPMHATSR